MGTKINESYESRLQNAGVAMKLASMDYDDNSGSPDASDFWNDFKQKRSEYKKIRDERR